MNEHLERRFYPAELRADTDSGKLDGYAAVYNRESEDLGGFVEVIEPGFFDGVLQDDVRALFNHNPDLILGRTKAGTLEIRTDEKGLRSVIEPPDTNLGRDVMTSVRRGDVDQMSFGFTVKADGDDWEKRDDGTVCRTLKAGGCARLFDVSPVTYPAYPQTSVSARSMAEAMQEQVIEQEPGGQADGGPEKDTREADVARARAAARQRQIEILRRRQ